MHRLPDRQSDIEFDIKGSGALEQKVNEWLGTSQQGQEAFVGGCRGSSAGHLWALHA